MSALFSSRGINHWGEQTQIHVHSKFNTQGILMSLEKTTIQISHRTKFGLLKIKGELLGKDGVNRTFDDIVQELMYYWKTGEKRKGYAL
jgi:hypothetical protein